MEELEIHGWGLSLDKLEDFCRRARLAGHNSFDTNIIMGYYDDVDGITLQSEYKESNDPAKQPA